MSRRNNNKIPVNAPPAPNPNDVDTGFMAQTRRGTAAKLRELKKGRKSAMTCCIATLRAIVLLALAFYLLVLALIIGQYAYRRLTGVEPELLSYITDFWVFVRILLLGFPMALGVSFLVINLYTIGCGCCKLSIKLCCFDLIGWWINVWDACCCHCRCLPKFKSTQVGTGRRRWWRVTWHMPHWRKSCWCCLCACLGCVDDSGDEDEEIDDIIPANSVSVHVIDLAAKEEKQRQKMIKQMAMFNEFLRYNASFVPSSKDNDKEAQGVKVVALEQDEI